MFEAGAPSKRLGKAKVCPILFGVQPADLKGPLVQFQAARFEKSELQRVVRMITRSSSVGAALGAAWCERWGSIKKAEPRSGDGR
jgi:hypothetical protein